MSSVHFISDLHLQDDQPALLAGFLAYLDGQANNAENLYILGDLFEFWIGDDVQTHTSEQVANALYARAQSGLKTFFLAGNRDFLVGEAYAERCGMTLLTEPQPITLAGQKTLLMHGDELCTDDEKYQQFRQMVRNPDWQKAFLSMPVAQRLQMAGQARTESQHANASKDSFIMDVNPDAVSATMTAHDVTILIHGHTHRPARHALTLGGRVCERIVLGDWGTTGWVLTADQQQLSLSEFSLPVGG